MDLRLDSSSHFSSVERVKVSRVLHFLNADRASTRALSDLENARVLVRLNLMMCQSDLARYFRSQRFLQLVKVTKKDPRTLYLVLECHISGDHGQNVTLSYDT